MENKNKKGLIALVAVLILIILFLVGYICCSKGLIFATDKKATPVEDEKLEYSVDVEGYKLNTTSKCGYEIKITLPKVTVNGSTDLKFNKMMENVIAEEYRSTFQENKAAYFVKNDLLAIYLKAFAQKENGDPDCGVGHTGHYPNATDINIFYDMKNDKILTFEEGMKYLGYTIDDLNKKAQEEYNKAKNIVEGFGEPMPVIKSYDDFLYCDSALKINEDRSYELYYEPYCL